MHLCVFPICDAPEPLTLPLTDEGAAYLERVAAGFRPQGAVNAIAAIRVARPALFGDDARLGPADVRALVTMLYGERVAARVD